MLTEAEIGWLAGIFEGEGSACICKTHFKRDNRPYICVARVVVVNNCDGTVLERVRKMLTELGFSPVVQIYDMRHKPCGKVLLNAHVENAAFLRLMLPLLDGYKKSQTQLVLAFLDRRIKRGRKIGSRVAQAEWKLADTALYNQQDEPRIVM